MFTRQVPRGERSRREARTPAREEGAPHFHKCCWFPPRSRGRLLRSAAVHRQSFHFETEDTGPAYTHPDENSTPQFTRAVQHNQHGLRVPRTGFGTAPLCGRRLGRRHKPATLEGGGEPGSRPPIEYQSGRCWQQQQPRPRGDTRAPWCSHGALASSSVTLGAYAPN